MNSDNPFFKQAQLMLEIIPFVAEEKCFALKGGTAINFFVRNMPRLSVDIDLTYLPIEDRETSLNAISESLSRISAKILKLYKRIKVKEISSRGGRRIVKLVVTIGNVQVKIEPNETFRGSVFQARERSLSPEVEKLFEISTSIQVLSIGDLYGGKLCAALDRQHPRDIFDVKLLLENEGIAEEIRRAFVVYISGHARPIHELLAPTLRDFKVQFEREFINMATSKVSYEELVSTRAKYIKMVKEMLTKDERKFLLSLKAGDPEWALLKIPNIEKLPAIQWKLMNINKMDKKKRQQMFTKLEKVLI